MQMLCLDNYENFFFIKCAEMLMKQCLFQINEQMDIVYRDLNLTELGCRLRFLLAQTLEDTLRGLFSECLVRPFGSCINGFGRMDCDVDMVFTHKASNQVYSRNLALCTCQYETPSGP